MEKMAAFKDFIDLVQRSDSFRSALHKTWRTSLFSLVIGLAYFAFLASFAYTYQQIYRTSLFVAMEETTRVAKRAAWSISIGLFIQSHPDGIRGKFEPDMNYRASAFLGPRRNDLAFSISAPSKFSARDNHLKGEVHITGNLAYDPSSGPAKSIPSGPWYEVTSWYRYFPYSSPTGETQRFSYVDDPLAGSRFPAELAPEGVFGSSYYSPPIDYFRSYRFSASVPDSLFREAIAIYIESQLLLFIKEEYAKWVSVGRFSTFLYFAATFGFGEIGPNSESVRILLIIQIIGSVIFGALIVPGLLSLLKKMGANTS